MKTRCWRLVQSRGWAVDVHSFFHFGFERFTGGDGTDNRELSLGWVAILF